jgi:hypothetical protein
LFVTDGAINLVDLTVATRQPDEKPQLDTKSPVDHGGDDRYRARHTGRWMIVSARSRGLCNPEMSRLTFLAGKRQARWSDQSVRRRRVSELF